MPGPVRSGIGRRGSAKYSCWTRTVISSWSPMISASGRCRRQDHEWPCPDQFVDVTGPRRCRRRGASMCASLEFFAANIRNPQTRRASYRAAEKFVTWCASAGVPSIAAVQPVHVHLDRGGDMRTGRTLDQTTARRPASPVRLAGQRPGRAGQPGIHSARTSACCDSRDKPRCSIRPKRASCSTASMSRRTPACAIGR